MKFSVATLIAIAGAAAALDKRTVDPAAATGSLLAALPSDLQSLALANPSSAAVVISNDIVSAEATGGVPTWFAALPTEVQIYFITQGEGASATSVLSSASSAISAANASATSAIAAANSSLASVTNSIKSSASSKLASASSAGASGASSASSSGGASVPTAIIGSGLAGLVGIVGMLAL